MIFGDISWYHPDPEALMPDLRYHSNSMDSDWGNWRTEILPLLRPLNVSVVTGRPILIDWLVQVFRFFMCFTVYFSVDAGFELPVPAK